MIRGCVICQRAPAKKAVCCDQKLCAEHELAHPCPRAAELLATDLQRWRKENAPETAFTTQVLAALNAHPGLTAWRTKRQPKAHQRDDTTGVLDISGFASPDGIAFFIETKRDHKDECGCPNCAGQRDFAARAAAAGCVVVLGVRTIQQAIDGVRMGLARARHRTAEGNDARSA